MKQVSVQSLLIAFIVALWTLSTAEANAADCNPSLFQAYVRENITDSKRLFFLKLITRENYEQIKSDSELGATILVDGTPLRAVAGFRDFQERRQKEYDQTKFKFDSDYSRDYLATDLSSNGLQAYIACLQRKNVFAAWVEPGTSSHELVSIRISWRPVKYQGNRLLTVRYYGVAEGERQVATQSLVDGGETTLTVKRIPNREFRATMNVDNAYSATVAIPPKPKIVRRPVSREISKRGTISWTRIDVAKHEYPCLRAPSGWTIVKRTVRISPPGSGPQAPRPWGAQLHSLDSTAACYHIWLSRYKSDPTIVDWSISATISATVEQFE